MALAFLVGLPAFALERWQSIYARRVQLQWAAFERWQAAMDEIQQLELDSKNIDSDKANVKENIERRAEIAFKKYFGLLHMEFLMRHHLNPQVMKVWNNFRVNEFLDEKLYGGKKFREWWALLAPGFADCLFLGYMDKCRVAAKK